MRLRLLGPSALRVSEVALGTMTFGEAWGWGAGRADGRRLLDLFLDRGGNFIDTASNYTDGESETYLGEMLDGRRDRVVVATKYTLTADPDDPNAGGNQRKALLRSLETSLRRLRTDRVDLLWMHMYDGLTVIDEVIRALDDQVSAGKVLAIGLSDTPAWVAARGAAIAELRGWTRVSAIQLPYGPASRDGERELLPMAAAHGLAVLAWGILGGGILSGGAVRNAGATPSEREARVAAELAALASQLDAPAAAVAVAWVLAQRRRANLIPILGARTPAQLEETLMALELELSGEQLARLDAAAAPDLGFPTRFLAHEEVVGLIFGRTRERIDA